VKSGEKPRWKPSRFDVQTTTVEGWPLVWNTYTGSVNAFRPEQRPAMLDLIRRKMCRAACVAWQLGNYLADRGYLVEQNIDELRRIQYAYGKEITAATDSSSSCWPPRIAISLHVLL